jgi:glycosyltransferase involved in cell wall biosynthesis
MSISIILPTLNEVQSISIIINDLRVYFPKNENEIIVVDDNSVDGTQLLISKLALEDNSLKLIERTTEIDGLPGAIFRGITESRYETVAWMDADGSMPASTLSYLAKKYENSNQIIVGSRFIPGGGFKGISDESRNVFKVWKNLRNSSDSFLAVVLSRGLNILLRILLRHGIKDYTSGFVVCAKSTALKVGLFGVYGDYCPKFLFTAASMGFDIIEVPYLNLPRKHGTSKSGTNLFQLCKRGFPYVTSAIKLSFKRR